MKYLLVILTAMALLGSAQATTSPKADCCKAAGCCKAGACCKK